MPSPAVMGIELIESCWLHAALCLVLSLFCHEIRVCYFWCYGAALCQINQQLHESPFSAACFQYRPIYRVVALIMTWCNTLSTIVSRMWQLNFDQCIIETAPVLYDSLMSTFMTDMH